MTTPARMIQPAPAARNDSVILRRCSCGDKAGQAGECEACRKRRLHRKGTAPGPAVAPPSVPAVLATPGQPLEPAVRTRMESRLGHDLGSVRVHADALSARAAREVGALAWSVGNRIAFGDGQYRPGTPQGDRLLAHELAHTLQSAAVAPHGDIPVGRKDDRAEREAEQVEEEVVASGTLGVVPGVALLERAPPNRVRRDEPDAGTAPPTATAAPAGQVPTAAAPPSVAPLLPGYSQQGDSCGAASLVTALLIWDREHARPGAPNDTLVNACDLILLAFARHGAAAVSRLTARFGGTPGLDPQQIHDDLRAAVILVRDSARAGTAVSEADYQLLGLSLYFLWVDQGGLSTGAISDIQASLGLAAAGPGSSAATGSFADIWQSSVFRALAPDQFVQIGWYVRTSPPGANPASYTHHALLAGRLADGTWFWTDQGPRPARQFTAASIGELETTVRAAAASGYWIFTGGISDFSRFVVGGWTGVQLLTGPRGVAGRLTGQVRAGAFLGEVDAGITTIGSTLTADAVLGTSYSLAGAEARFTGTTGGGSALIIEMPAGVFLTYAASPVSDANLGETTLDADDSSGGVLAHRTFVHAWLILGTASGRRGSRFRVY